MLASSSMLAEVIAPFIEAAERLSRKKEKTVVSDSDVIAEGAPLLAWSRDLILLQDPQASYWHRGGNQNEGFVSLEQRKPKRITKRLS